jgi:hypothetical protein
MVFGIQPLQTGLFWHYFDGAIWQQTTVPTTPTRVWVYVDRNTNEFSMWTDTGKAEQSGLPYTDFGASTRTVFQSAAGNGIELEFTYLVRGRGNVS